jgi:hypothetical protein
MDTIYSDLPGGSFTAFLNDAEANANALGADLGAAAAAARLLSQPPHSQQVPWQPNEVEEDDGGDGGDGQVLATQANTGGNKRKREANYTLEEMTAIIQLRCAPAMEARIANKLVRRTDCAVSLGAAHAAQRMTHPRAREPQHTSDNVWDIVYERFKRMNHGTQRTKESIRGKFDAMNQEFRKACREMQRRAKSGAGRDDLAAVKKPPYFDVFMSMSWWKKPMATPHTVSLQGDDLDDDTVWFTKLYDEEHPAPALHACVTSQAGVAGVAAASRAAADDAWGDAGENTPPTADGDTPAPAGGPIGGTQAAGKNKTHAPRGRPSTSAQSARNSDAANTIARGNVEAMTSLATVFKDMDTQRAEREEKARREEAALRREETAMICGAMREVASQCRQQ